MSESIDLFSIVIAFVLVASGWVLFSSLFSTSAVSEERPPPKNHQEARERREERQERIKAEYEQKRELKLKARNEKDKIYQEKKENEKREVENTKREKEEKKRIKQENKKDFFSWLKPKIRTHKLSNGDKIIVDSSQVQKAKHNTSFFGSSNSEDSSIENKLDNLAKELKDL